MIILSSYHDQKLLAKDVNLLRICSLNPREMRTQRVAQSCSRSARRASGWAYSQGEGFLGALGAFHRRLDAASKRIAGFALSHAGHGDWTARARFEALTDDAAQPRDLQR